MKKITLLTIACLAIAMFTHAQTLNNPKDADGYYIVKWDCSLGAFAAANDFEADESFTFAIDVTGTPFENWLKETPTADGATRSLCFNKWTNWGALRDATARLRQISGNVYGATYNIAQMATEEELLTNAVTIDSVVVVEAQVFGFEFTADNPGAGWWMWPDGLAEATAIDPGTGAVFKTLPYTGTKTSPELWSDDFEGGLFFSNNTPEKGYTLPCALTPVSVSKVTVTDSPVISHEYFNILGVRLQREPQQGLFIHRMLKEDGTTEVVKEFKLREF